MCRELQEVSRGAHRRLFFCPSVLRREPGRSLKWTTVRSRQGPECGRFAFVHEDLVFQGFENREGSPRGHHIWPLDQTSTTLCCSLYFEEQALLTSRRRPSVAADAQTSSSGRGMVHSGACECRRDLSDARVHVSMATISINWARNSGCHTGNGAQGGRAGWQNMSGSVAKNNVRSRGCPQEPSR